MTSASAVALMLSALAAPSAGVGPLGIQAQAQYEIEEVHRRDLPSISRGYLSTNYTLSLRRRFVPTSTLLSDLTFTGSGNSGQGAGQDTRGWTLNLVAEQPKYMLMTRIIRNRYSTDISSSASATGSSTSYNTGIFVRQPAWPVVNVQYIRNDSSSSFAGATSDYVASTWLTSLSYDASPFRFLYDRNQRTVSTSTASTNKVTSQTATLILDQPITSTLSAFGELSRTSTDVSYRAGSNETTTDRRLARLIATPVPSTVVEVAFTKETNDQSVGLLRGTNGYDTLSWNVRSEPLRGLSVDAVNQRQSQKGSGYFGTFDSVSTNRSITVAARLPQGAVLSATKTRLSYDTPAPSGDVTQDGLQASFQSALTRSTDLSVNYGRNRSTTGGVDRFDSVTKGITVRDRRSARLSVGASYRRLETTSNVLDDDEFIQKGDAIDIDVLSQPNYNLGVGVRLSYQNNTGSSAFRTLSPGVNLRWQIDSKTNLTANWTSQRFRQYDADNALAFGQDTRGLSARMTRTFKNGAYMDVSYDFQGNSISDVAWRRRLRVGFTVNR